MFGATGTAAEICTVTHNTAAALIHLKICTKRTLHANNTLLKRAFSSISTNDRALFARFARSNLNFQEPGNGDTKLSGKGRGEDTCYMSHVILAKLET